MPREYELNWDLGTIINVNVPSFSNNQNSTITYEMESDTNTFLVTPWAWNRTSDGERISNTTFAPDGQVRVTRTNGEFTEEPSPWTRHVRYFVTETQTGSGASNVVNVKVGTTEGDNDVFEHNFAAPRSSDAINKIELGAFAYSGVLRNVRMQVGSNDFEWAIDDLAPDGGVIKSASGNEDGVLDLGGGYWQNVATKARVFTADFQATVSIGHTTESVSTGYTLRFGVSTKIAIPDVVMGGDQTVTYDVFREQDQDVGERYPWWHSVDLYASITGQERYAVKRESGVLTVGGILREVFMAVEEIQTGDDVRLIITGDGLDIDELLEGLGSNTGAGFNIGPENNLGIKGVIKNFTIKNALNIPVYSWPIDTPVPDGGIIPDVVGNRDGVLVLADGWWVNKITGQPIFVVDFNATVSMQQLVDVEDQPSIFDVDFETASGVHIEGDYSIGIIFHTIFDAIVAMSLEGYGVTTRNADFDADVAIGLDGAISKVSEVDFSANMGVIVQGDYSTGVVFNVIFDALVALSLEGYGTTTRNVDFDADVAIGLDGAISKVSEVDFLANIGIQVSGDYSIGIIFYAVFDAVIALSTSGNQSVVIPTEFDIATRIGYATAVDQQAFDTDFDAVIVMAIEQANKVILDAEFSASLIAEYITDNAIAHSRAFEATAAISHTTDSLKTIFTDFILSMAVHTEGDVSIGNIFYTDFNALVAIGIAGGYTNIYPRDFYAEIKTPMNVEVSAAFIQAFNAVVAIGYSVDPTRIFDADGQFTLAVQNLIAGGEALIPLSASYQCIHSVHDQRQGILSTVPGDQHIASVHDQRQGILSTVPGDQHIASIHRTIQTIISELEGCTL